MGGNISINGYTAQPIVFDKLQNRHTKTWSSLESFIGGLRDAFLDKHQWPLTVDYPVVGSGRSVIESTHSIVKIGDLDVQVYAANRDWLIQLLVVGSTYGDWTVKGTKGHGNELSCIIASGETIYHQIDFQFVDDPGSAKQVFMHSAPLYDAEAGIKGAYHKILLNAVGLDEYKFSISRGLCRRDTDEQVPFEQWEKCLVSTPEHSSIFLNTNISSFRTLVDAIKECKTRDQLDAIYNKFITHVNSTLRHDDSTTAIEYLKNAIESR